MREAHRQQGHKYSEQAAYYTCPTDGCGHRIYIKFPAASTVDHEMSSVLERIRQSQIFYILCVAAAEMLVLVSAVYAIVTIAMRSLSASYPILVMLVAFVVRITVRPQAFRKPVVVDLADVALLPQQVINWGCLVAVVITTLVAPHARRYLTVIVLATNAFYAYLSFHDYCYCRLLRNVEVSAVSQP